MSNTTIPGERGRAQMSKSKMRSQIRINPSYGAGGIFQEFSPQNRRKSNSDGSSSPF
jgi:hypothetical protein